MGNNIIVFHFFDPETSKMSKKRKKREPNMFISYRKDMMRNKPYNIPMTEFSKLVSEQWKRLTRDEKTELQRKYQINRDKKSQQNAFSEYITVIDQSNSQPEAKVNNCSPQLEVSKEKVNNYKASLSNILNDYDDE